MSKLINQFRNEIETEKNDLHKIDILFLSSIIYFDPEKSLYYLGEEGIGSLTLKFNLSKEIDRNKEKIINILDIDIIQNIAKKENMGELILELESIIEKEIEKSDEKGNIFILGISINDIELPTIATIVSRLKSKYKNFLIIGGGPSLKKYNNELINHLFNIGFDCLNIGGGKEFIDLLTKINNKKAFIKKDANGVFFDTKDYNLSENIIFKDKEHKNKKLGINLRVPIISDGDCLGANFGEACKNNCKYCVVSRTKEDKNVTKDVINDLNDKIKSFRDDSKLIYLQIKDPNIMQDLDKLESILSKLDLEGIGGMGSFGDIYSFENIEYVNRLLDLIYKYKFKSINFGRDTIQAKSDGDIIGKTRKNKLITQGSYDKVEQNLKFFLNELDKKYNSGLTVPGISINYIFHPDMDLGVFNKKINEYKFVSKYIFVPKITILPLIPFYGTQVRKEGKGYFIDPLDISLEYSSILKKMELSLYGLEYKNAYLLDVFKLSNLFGDLLIQTEEKVDGIMFFEDILNIIQGNDNNLNILHKYYKEESLEEITNYIRFLHKKSKKEFLDYIFYFFNNLINNYLSIDNLNITDVNYYKYKKKLLEEFYIFIEYREKHLEQTSSSYKKLLHNEKGI